MKFSRLSTSTIVVTANICQYLSHKKDRNRATRFVQQPELPTHALLPAYADRCLNMRTDDAAYGLVFANHWRISGKGYESLAGL